MRFSCLYDIILLPLAVYPEHWWLTFDTAIFTFFSNFYTLPITSSITIPTNSKEHFLFSWSKLILSVCCFSSSNRCEEISQTDLDFSFPIDQWCWTDSYTDHFCHLWSTFVVWNFVLFLIYVIHFIGRLQNTIIA